MLPTKNNIYNYYKKCSFLYGVLLTIFAFNQSNGSCISGYVYGDDNHGFKSAPVNVKNFGTGFNTSTSKNKKGYFSFRKKLKYLQLDYNQIF